MKKSLLFLLALTLIVSIAAISQAGLVSLFALDGNAQNSVSATSNGTIVGTPTFGPGVIGSAITSNANLDQYINLPSTTVPHPEAWGQNTYGFWYGTISMWLKSTNNNDDGVDFFHMENNWTTNAEGDRNYWGVKANTMNGDLEMYQCWGGGGYFTNLTAPNRNWLDGQWHQVTWTYDSRSASVAGAIYIDGVSKNITSLAGQGFNSTRDQYWDPGQQVRNTKLVNSPQGYDVYSGSMDDAAFFNYQFTPAQAKALYNLGKDSLNYGALKTQSLFDLYAGPDGGTTMIDGKNWQKITSGLTGNPGDIITYNGQKALVLGSGSGVSIVPEPGTLTLLGAAAIGLLVFARRNGCCFNCGR